MGVKVQRHKINSNLELFVSRSQGKYKICNTSTKEIVLNVMYYWKCIIHYEIKHSTSCSQVKFAQEIKEKDVT